jgi:methyl-accepting chemotaxis protein
VEALLAEKEEEMNGLMEVMDSLQNEIRTKAEIIEFLEEQVNKIKPDQ